MASDVLPAASEKAAVVQNMFDRIAPEYDRMNGLMTAGFDRAWRRAVIAEAAIDRGVRTPPRTGARGALGCPRGPR